MAEIEIFLSVDETQISTLSIPRSDIERLTVSPFRWIRYVMFAICGARGDLSTTPNGPAVDYEATEIANDDNTYYYRPSGPCAFVDYEGLNERKTSTEATTRRPDFRDDVVQRDGPACIITETEERDCDAAHLLPHSKGDEYIVRVMRLRSPEDASAPRPQIDMTENGILISKTLHSMHSRGLVAFIKTPNYELRPEHIKRFRRGEERQAYITLQWIRKPVNFNPQYLERFQAIQNAGIDPGPLIAHAALKNVDALFQGAGVPLPYTAVLDYLYGVAVYKAWRSQRDDGFYQIMQEYRNEHYTEIPPLSPATSNGNNTDVTDVTVTDDPNDTEYNPSQNSLEETMDELSMFLMYVHGITPEMAAERRQKKIEREEREAEEASRIKVVEWKNHLDVY